MEILKLKGILEKVIFFLLIITGFVLAGYVSSGSYYVKLSTTYPLQPALSVSSVGPGDLTCNQSGITPQKFTGNFQVPALQGLRLTCSTAALSVGLVVPTDQEVDDDFKAPDPVSTGAGFNLIQLDVHYDSDDDESSELTSAILINNNFPFYDGSGAPAVIQIGTPSVMIRQWYMPENSVGICVVSFLALSFASILFFVVCYASYAETKQAAASYETVH